MSRPACHRHAQDGAAGLLGERAFESQISALQASGGNVIIFGG
jgi:hypothetical protein